MPGRLLRTPHLHKLPLTCLNSAAATAAAGIKSGAEYLARVAFGTALIVSVVAVYTAIMVIATSSSKDERRSNNNSSSFGGGGGALRMFNATDMLWYWDPFYSRHRRERMQQQPQGMNFLEAIYSWVFGDGDPNANFDRERWQAVSAPCRRRRRRCVSAALGGALGACCLGPPAGAYGWWIGNLMDSSCSCPRSCPAPCCCPGWEVHPGAGRHCGGGGAGSLPGPAAGAAGL